MNRNNCSYTLLCCAGLSIDLLQSLSNELGFDYNLYLSPDGSYGAPDHNTGEWSGMVREILDGEFCYLISVTPYPI